MSCLDIVKDYTAKRKIKKVLAKETQEKVSLQDAVLALANRSDCISRILRLSCSSDSRMSFAYAQQGV